MATRLRGRSYCRPTLLQPSAHPRRGSLGLIITSLPSPVTRPAGGVDGPTWSHPEKSLGRIHGYKAITWYGELQIFVKARQGCDNHITEVVSTANISHGSQHHQERQPPSEYKEGYVVEDVDAVVCGYAEEPGQALRNITLNVREVSFRRRHTGSSQTPPQKHIHVQVMSLNHGEVFIPAKPQHQTFDKPIPREMHAFIALNPSALQ